MSVPRITQILEGEIQSRLDSQDVATREKATSDYLAFATLCELRRIRFMVQESTSISLSNADVESMAATCDSV